MSDFSSFFFWRYLKAAVLFCSLFRSFFAVLVRRRFTAGDGAQDCLSVEEIGRDFLLRDLSMHPLSPTVDVCNVMFGKLAEESLWSSTSPELSQPSSLSWMEGDGESNRQLEEGESTSRSGEGDTADIITPGVNGCTAAVVSKLLSPSSKKERTSFISSSSDK